MIFRPLMFDCLLSIQHHLYPQRLHFPESPSHIALGQSLSMKGMQDIEDGSEERLWYLRIFGMSHGWTWDDRNFQGLLGVPTLLYRPRCSVWTFPERLENFRSLPMRLLRTTKSGSLNEVFRWLFLQSSASAFLTFTHAAFPAFLQSILPIFSPFIPIRHRTVLFLPVCILSDTPLCPDLWPPQDTGSTL